VFSLISQGARKAKNCSLYGCYRCLGYSRSVLVKTFAFYLTIFLLKRVEGIIAVSRFTAKIWKTTASRPAKFLSAATQQI